MAGGSGRDKDKVPHLRLAPVLKTVEPEKPVDLKSETTEGAPIMVRDLDGRIYFWNTTAEEQYGWSNHDAIGNVSHALLRTIFPEPLEVINNVLMNRGSWNGSLIHTRADGTQVKVSSKWELYRDEDGRLCTVLEVNDRFFPLAPGSAHLAPTIADRFRTAKNFLMVRKQWVLGPMIVIAAAALIAWFITGHGHMVPLSQRF